MKIFNVGLIGYGKMGKIFAKEIKRKNNFNLKKILTRKILNKNLLSVKKFFNEKDIDVFIITSPIWTHFKYLKYAYEANKDIIIEKPIVENLNQFKKLLTLNKKFKKKILIHHNDLLNFEKNKILKRFGKLNNLRKIKMIYGKHEYYNSYKKPFFDWLPHPLAIITNLFGKPSKFKILKYKKMKIKSKIIEYLDLSFTLNNFEVFLHFSNNLNKPSKKVIFYENKRKKIYDGYLKKNRRTVKILLEKYCNSKYINDLNSNIDTYKLLFQIEKKLLKQS